MKLLSIWPHIRLCRVTAAALLTLCLFCSACTPAGESSAPAAEKSARTPLKNVTRPHTILTYSPEINRYPMLAQRLAAETQKLLDMDCGFYEIDIDEIDRRFDGEGSTSYSICRLDYEMTAETYNIVAVLGSFYYLNEFMSHGKFGYSTHVWLLQEQKWLTIQQLLSDSPGWIAVRDYVREELYMQYVPRGDWSTAGTSTIDDFALFRPLMDHGQIAALRFIFPPYQVAAFAAGTLEVDVPASVLYPHVSAEYRDLFVQP